MNWLTYAASYGLKFLPYVWYLCCVQKAMGVSAINQKKIQIDYPIKEYTLQLFHVNLDILLNLVNLAILGHQP
jgi:hypothetical protein